MSSCTRVLSALLSQPERELYTQTLCPTFEPGTTWYVSFKFHVSSLVDVQDLVLALFNLMFLVDCLSFEFDVSSLVLSRGVDVS